MDLQACDHGEPSAEHTRCCRLTPDLPDVPTLRKSLGGNCSNRVMGCWALYPTAVCRGAQSRSVCSCRGESGGFCMTYMMKCTWALSLVCRAASAIPERLPLGLESLESLQAPSSH